VHFPMPQLAQVCADRDTLIADRDGAILCDNHIASMVDELHGDELQKHDAAAAQLQEAYDKRTDAPASASTPPPASTPHSALAPPALDPPTLDPTSLRASLAPISLAPKFPDAAATPLALHDPVSLLVNVSPPPRWTSKRSRMLSRFVENERGEQWRALVQTNPLIPFVTLETWCCLPLDDNFARRIAGLMRAACPEADVLFTVEGLRETWAAGTARRTAAKRKQCENVDGVGV